MDVLNLQVQPLTKLEQPLLFLVGDSDRLCTLEQLAKDIQQMPSQDIRVEVFEVGLGLTSFLTALKASCSTSA